jgi:predicted acetyltransferase
VIFEVRDLFCPWNEGRYALEVGPDGVICESTEAEPDLVCSVNDLGSAFLGGFTLGHMAAAGLVLEVSPGALATADAMFASAPAPWCPFTF